MITVSEFRFGNLLLQKNGPKITKVPFGLQHIDLLVNSDLSALYPIVLKPDILEKCGFQENKKYPLLPEAREFILVLPVPGGNKNELRVYNKSNGECFGRALVNDAVASQNFFQLHQLQNLFYSLTGAELDISAVK